MTSKVWSLRLKISEKHVIFCFIQKPFTICISTRFESKSWDSCIFLKVSETYIKPSHHYNLLSILWCLSAAYIYMENWQKSRDLTLTSFRHRCHGNDISIQYCKCQLYVICMPLSYYISRILFLHIANEIKASFHYLMNTPRTQRRFFISPNAGHNKRKIKTRQKKEVGWQYKRMDKDGLCQHNSDN